ncbi:bifunctional transaldolase/phosoglucose isomerase [Siccirubricoccus sp. KC 17139]|uniref:Transaldolase n=1 Tax=Siccirubricoccus soli TaxID=2899147 RepID=A0ABT1D658_9PROT|nr:bifunctional transaldolase/phosoglucose isomerase [Siccirubricoccus soli]MCO6417401.1 bifunctional transaldolase/phosoglucose isomerase [Siccirubricoccus soli]MCP2683536.1 bifunctional transaldolase/phosoglucose isomerase [Siccirubricoccus soli]
MSSTTNPLRRLAEFGQSPWLDFIRRGFIADGSLHRLVQADGLKGVTSNPAIFEKAIGEGTDYDEGFRRLAAKGDHGAVEIYEYLAIEDIRAACDVLRPVYEATRRVDGYVSLEVSPYLALRTEETVAEARRLWSAVNRPNLMVKVPGTEAGVPAIQRLTSEGINVNVTLLFARSAYAAVAEAFIAGLEERAGRGEDISHVASVASFFVSRIDTQIDKEIDRRIAAGDPESDALRRLRGRAAIANAKLAYVHYQELAAGSRWRALRGAMPQRLLWASTGVKDKAYRDVMYAEELIGPDTVDTLPPATMDAFRDHGRPRASLTEGLDEAREVLAMAERLGLDLDAVTQRLVPDGVRQFADAADQLLGAVAAKRTAMLGDRLLGLEVTLPEAESKAVEAELARWRAEGGIRRLWAGDAGLWTGTDEARWLGWLRILDERSAHLEALLAFQRELREEGFTHAVLLGMGGSSLGPEVLAETFGRQEGYPELLVLDSTDPAQIAAFEARCDLARTLVIVSSKSGSTLEPNILKAYFWERLKAVVGPERVGRHFVAVTDPGSQLERVAGHDGFRRVFPGDPSIGGRYSVLSNFGLVPAAVMGLDLRRLLASAALMARSCGADVPPAQNPGVRLGAVLGVLGRAGRDKVTLTASPGVADLGAWLEQLIAESTGKVGRGLVPVDGETLGAPDAYGGDRLFAHLRLDAGQDAPMEALARAGQPVVRLALTDRWQLGQAFFLWEMAVAVAGSILGINPFDQPDVEASKVRTRALTAAYAVSGTLPAEAPALTEDGLAVFGEVAPGGFDAAIRAHLGQLGEGDYFALLAYVERSEAHRAALQRMRMAVRDARRVATVAEFGPRFLHSTGQAYKGGPNSGVFLQITAAPARDLPVPGEKYSFGIVEAAQAQGDLEVLRERGRRVLRVHLGLDTEAGLRRLEAAVVRALG